MRIRTGVIRMGAATGVAVMMATAGILAYSGEAVQTTQKVGTMRIEMFSDTASPIYELGFSVQNVTDTSGGGGGAGKATFSEIQVVRPPDATSPALLNAAVTGRHIPRVQLDIKTATSDSSYTLTDVLVSGYSTTDGLEKIAFSFARIQFTAGGATTCFDLRMNAAC